MDVSSMSNMSSLMGRMSGMGSRPDPSQMFGKMDKNRDGGLDQSEFQNVSDKISAMSGQSMDVEEIFNAFDADSDGMLSQEETRSAMEAHMPSGPPGGGMMPSGMIGSFDPASMGIDQYKQASALGGTDDLVSTLLDALSEEDQDEKDDEASANTYTSINTTA